MGMRKKDSEQSWSLVLLILMLKFNIIYDDTIIMYRYILQEKTFSITLHTLLQSC